MRKYGYLYKLVSSFIRYILHENYKLVKDGV